MYALGGGRITFIGKHFLHGVIIVLLKMHSLDVSLKVTLLYLVLFPFIKCSDARLDMSELLQDLLK